MSRANPRTTHDNAGIAAVVFKLKTEIGSYHDCVSFFEAERSSAFSDEPVKLGPHMLVRPHRTGALMLADYYAVVLYDTEIIRYYPDGTFSVDNGGFATPTTMYRLNAVLPGGWIASHHRKLLRLTKHSGKNRMTVYPATHEKRVSP